jgi:hypothetical protein
MKVHLRLEHWPRSDQPLVAMLHGTGVSDRQSAGQIDGTGVCDRGEAQAITRVIATKVCKVGQSF